MRILVIDDDPGVRTTLVRILQYLGHDVVEAAGGEEAERLPAEEPFQAVFADLRLPGTSGDRLIGRLRERWPGIHAVLMTGDADRDEVRAGVLEGRWRLLSKPFNLDQVADHLRRLV